MAWLSWRNYMYSYLYKLLHVLIHVGGSCNTMQQIEPSHNNKMIKY